MEMAAIAIVQCDRLSAVSRAMRSHCPASNWFDCTFVFGIRSTPIGKRSAWCSAQMFTRCTTARAITIAATQET